MAFVHALESYSVAEFYDNFGHNLPKIVVVTEGFYGEIHEEIFARSQVIRLHTISRQKRVVARMEQGQRTLFISIPLTYEELLCTLDKHGKEIKKEPISQIIKNNILPVNVRFPKEKMIVVSSQSISTNHIPSMELTKCFDEVYLLGNFINEGKMLEEVINVPLYLSQLKLAIVNGMSERDTETWKKYQKDLDVVCSNMKYDKEFGNKEIAVYDPSCAKHSDTLYAYIEPTMYVSTDNLIRRATNGSNSKNDVKRSPVSTGHRNPTKPPPPAIPEPRPVKFEQPSKPTLPIRMPKELAKAVLEKDVNETVYANDVPRSNILPMTSRQTIQDQLQNQLKDSTIDIAKELTKITTNDNADNKAKINIAQLTIEDIGEYLTKLKLEKYRDKFKDLLIDGRMLMCMDRQTLVDELNMSVIEAFRLLNFAQDSHIPV